MTNDLAATKYLALRCVPHFHDAPKDVFPRVVDLAGGHFGLLFQVGPFQLTAAWSDEPAEVGGGAVFWVNDRDGEVVTRWVANGPVSADDFARTLRDLTDECPVGIQDGLELEDDRLGHGTTWKEEVI